MDYSVYPTAEAALVALDAVNTAFAATLPAGSVTQRWCDSPTACAEGWALPTPEEPFRAHLGDGVIMPQINAL